MKYNALDKFDSYIPKPKQFIHGESYISTEVDRFSVSSGTMWVNGKRKPVHFGVSKREWNASSRGIYIDQAYIGKNE